MACTARGSLLRVLALVLLGCQGFTDLLMPWAGTHSLRYDISIENSLPGQWLHKIQGYLDEMAFLNYSSSDDKVSPLGPLGKKISATDTWKKQTESLKDMQNLLYQKLLDIQPNYKSKEPLALQVTLYCQRKGSGHVHSSLLFDLNGQRFSFTPGNRKWTEDHPGSSRMKEWKDDSDMSEFLYRTALGDCTSWLEEFSAYSGEALKPTAPPATTPNKSQPKSTAMVPETCDLLIILTCSMLLVRYG